MARIDGRADSGGRLGGKARESAQVALWTAAAYLLLTLIVFLWADALQPWIETVNGATWPNSWRDNNRVGFSLAVAFRTVVNLWVVYYVAYFTATLINARKKAKMELRKLLHIRNSTTALRVLEALHGVNLTEKQETDVRNAVKDAGDAWDKKHLPRFVGAEMAEKLLSTDHQK